MPFHSPVKIFLCDTQVERALAESGYNQRRTQCEAGVALLRKYAPDVHSLRDVSLELLDAHRAELDPIVYRRCRYVIEENCGSSPLALLWKARTCRPSVA